MSDYYRLRQLIVNLCANKNADGSMCGHCFGCKLVREADPERVEDRSS